MNTSVRKFITVLSVLVSIGLSLATAAIAQAPPSKVTLSSDNNSGDSVTEAVEALARDDSAAVLHFDSAITELESASGPYATGLPEQLLGLGMLLQQQGKHERAVDLFKRGVHLARINSGLYSNAQIPLLRSEIESLRALGRFSDVDERQRYLYRVERRSLGNGLASVNALIRQGEWQRDAYLIGLDASEMAAQRLLIMWDVYRLALNQLIDIYGNNQIQLLPALEGMLTSQYLIAGFQSPGNANSANTADLRLSAYTSEAYKRGKSVLRAIMEINAAANGDDPLIRSRDLLRLGDWAWWFGNRREAMQPYKEALALAEQADMSGTVAAEIFASPEALPQVEGIPNLPKPKVDKEGDLVVSFTVTATGRVRELERLRQPEVEAGRGMGQFIRRIKNTRFRPRLSDGEAVSTRGVVWAFDQDDWQGLQ